MSNVISIRRAVFSNLFFLSLRMSPSTITMQSECVLERILGGVRGGLALGNELSNVVASRSFCIADSWIARCSRLLCVLLLLGCPCASACPRSV